MKVLASIILALLFVGCSSDKKEEMKEEVKTAKVKVEKKIDTHKIKETIKEKTSTLVTSVKDSTSYVVDAMIPEKADGKLLYLKCMGCHGEHGEKKALGKSAVIQGWDSQKIIDALNGYSEGLYGGPLKGMMKSQADKLDKKEKEAIAAYISGL